jgi:hypothetical protein
LDWRVIPNILPFTDKKVAFLADFKTLPKKNCHITACPLDLLKPIN